MTATLLREQVESGSVGDDPLPPETAGTDLDRMLDQTLHTRDDFWIQTVCSDSGEAREEIYLSTFQEGRGQHLTTLTPREARVLGERLLRLAHEAVAA